MFLQPYEPDFFLAVIKVVGSHESRIHWTHMKNSEVRIKPKNKYGKLKTLLSIWSLKRKRFPDDRLFKQNQETVKMWECNNYKLTTGKLILQW